MHKTAVKAMYDIVRELDEEVKNIGEKSFERLISESTRTGRFIQLDAFDEYSGGPTLHGYKSKKYKAYDEEAATDIKSVLRRALVEIGLIIDSDLASLDDDGPADAPAAKKYAKRLNSRYDAGTTDEDRDAYVPGIVAAYDHTEPPTSAKKSGTARGRTLFL